jgi:trehalose-6-phosphate synthase
MTPEQQLIAYQASATNTAIATLVQMLERRGVLEAGAYANAIKDTVNHPNAEFGRPDYVMLAHLAQFLDGQFGAK